AQHHLAWQAITDRQLANLAPKLKALIADKSQPAGKRIGALWALEGLSATDAATLKGLLSDSNRNLRREGMRAFTKLAGAPSDRIAALEQLVDDPDPEVRAEVIRTAGQLIHVEPRAISICVKMARAALAEPSGKSTHSGNTIRLREAYEREFERYLSRFFLEQQPQAVAGFLESGKADSLPLENRMVATLALEPKTGAPRVAQLLPELKRPPADEELLRLAQFPDEPGVAGTLKTLFVQPDPLEALLKVRTRFDATKLLPPLNDAAGVLWERKATRPLALRLTSAFKLSKMEAVLNHALISDDLSARETLDALRAVRELGANHLEGIISFRASPDPEIANEAILALASSRNRLAPDFILKKFWRDLTGPQQRIALTTLAGGKPGARAIVEAARDSLVEKADLD
ncbi:MAG: hypothetical protein L0Z53_01400, partial [Acidobacteriales bacterium]|nr:hypothetical protein [Terriglobales bacterium]